MLGISLLHRVLGTTVSGVPPIPAPQTHLLGDRPRPMAAPSTSRGIASKVGRHHQHCQHCQYPTIPSAEPLFQRCPISPSKAGLTHGPSAKRQTHFLQAGYQQAKEYLTGQPSAYSTRTANMQLGDPPHRRSPPRPMRLAGNAVVVEAVDRHVDLCPKL